MKKRIVGFVPAKARSKRVPSKNRQEILGVPLFLWAAGNLARVLDPRDIYVDSNGEEILEAARAHGFNTLRRPEQLATNQVDGNRFFAWEVSQVEADVYIQHLPPMPFLRTATLERGLAEVLSGRHDSAFAAYRRHFYLWDPSGRPLYDVEHIPNSFDLPEMIVEGMGLYIITAEAHRETGTRIGRHPYLLSIEGEETIDIDTPADLAFARVVARGLQAEGRLEAGVDGAAGGAAPIKEQAALGG